jgi:20S proteasome alpha/beta subunit
MQTKFINQLKTFYNDWWVETGKDSDFGLIISVRGEIYEHSAGDMSLSKYTVPFLAMGSGSEYAMGYLDATQKTRDARKRVVGAVNSAIKFSPSCMGPVDVISI